MNRVVCFGATVALCCLAQNATEPAAMPADAHAPLFHSRTNQAGSTTQKALSQIPAQAVQSAPVPRHNFIDDEIFGRIEREKIPHSPLATDREFVRRVKLDLEGRIPTPQEVREFLADTSPDK